MYEIRVYLWLVFQFAVQQHVREFEALVHFDCGVKLANKAYLAELRSEKQLLVWHSREDKAGAEAVAAGGHVFLKEESLAVHALKISGVL